MTALLPALFLLLAATAPPLRAQSHTEVWAGLSVGLFDGFGIGLTHYAHSGGVGLGIGASVATGTTRYANYGIYDDDYRGRGYGDYSGARGYRDRGYSDYCWDRAWDLRWGRRYYGWDGYGYPSYDHLDFYHDCLSGGVGYAYSRWGSHARRAYHGGYYGRYNPWIIWDDWGWGRRSGWGVHVQVYVTDPFWRPWGPYWAYDPWGWYWDGFRDGRRSRGGGWGGYDGWGGGVRTVWTDGRGGWGGRRSPLGPGYKEDPSDRRVAVPRGGGRTVSVSAPGTTGDRVGPTDGDARIAGSRRPSADGGRLARPGADGGTIERSEPGVRAPDRGVGTDGGRVARTRPSDALRGGRGEAADGTPAIGDADRGGRAEPAAPRVRGSGDRPTDRAGGGFGDEPTVRATPRSRPTDGLRGSDRGGADGGDEPRARPSFEPRDEPRAEPRARPSLEPRDEPRAEPRARPSFEPRDDPAPGATRERPSSGRSGGERTAPAIRDGGERSAPPPRSGGERSAPSARSGRGERSAPAVPSGGGERSAPAPRSGGERSAPSARSGGGERSAPAARSGGGERSAPPVRSGGSSGTARRRGDG